MRTLLPRHSVRNWKGARQKRTLQGKTRILRLWHVNIPFASRARKLLEKRDETCTEPAARFPLYRMIQHNAFVTPFLVGSYDLQRPLSGFATLAHLANFFAAMAAAHTRPFFGIGTQ
jgi:hypothetical protein